MPVKMPTVEMLAPNTEPPSQAFEPPSRAILRRMAAKPVTAPAATPVPSATPVKDPNEAPPVETPPPVTADPKLPPQQQPQGDPEDKGTPGPGDKEKQEAQKPEAEQPKQEPAKEPEGQEKNISKAWASVMRKEREVQKAVQEVREYQKDQAAYNEFRQLKPDFEAFKQAKQLAATNPDEALRLLGVKGGYNEASERMLDLHSKGEVKTPQERTIESLVSKLDALEKRLVEKETKREQDEAKLTVDSYLRQLDKYARDNEQNYPFVVENNAVGLVFDTMKGYYEKNGKYLSEQEACEMVENYFRGEARKLVSKPHIRKALDLEPPAEPPTPAPQAKPPEQTAGSKANTEPPKTLTNSLPTGGVPVVKPGHFLSRDQQIRDLVARKYGQAV